jgi:hypothetical protein
MHSLKSFPIFFLVSLMLLSLPALALRDDLCNSLGKGLEFLSAKKCQDANQSEYELACSMSSYGKGFRHGDGKLNFRQYKDYGYSSAGDYADAMTEEVLMNLAANNIAESNRCMVNFYDQFQDEKSGISSWVKKSYSSIKPQLTNLLPQGAVGRAPFLKPSSTLVNKARTIDIVARDATDGPRVKFDALIASIPLGNHEEVRNYIALAVINNYDEAKFYSGFKKVVQNLSRKHRESLDVMNSYKIKNYEPIYNVREGERGSESLRDSLRSSGAIENIIFANNLENDFAPGYLCRTRRHDRGCMALTAIEIGGSLVLPYAAASIGLRAGLALASRGLTSWSTARFVAHAMSRGLLFSGYVGQLSLLTDDAVGQCLQSHPEYLNSKSRATCEPEKMVFEATSEAVIANCLSTVALGLAPIGLSAIADDAIRLSRMAKVESKLGIVVEDASRIARTAPAEMKVGEEIVVTAKRPSKNTVTERFIARTHQWSYDRHFRRYSAEYKKAHPEAPESEVTAFASKAAEAKRARLENLHRQCTSVKTPEAIKAAAIFSKYSVGFGVGNTLLSYSIATWDKVKDFTWGKRLGYELTKAIILSWLNSRIQSSGSTSFPKKVTNTMKLSFLGNIGEALATQGIFQNTDDAKQAMSAMAESPHFTEDVNGLLDYLNNRNELQTYVDGIGDMSNNLMRAITGKNEVHDMTAEELSKLDQNALKNPEVRERMLDLIDDKLNSEEDKIYTTGNIGLDRFTFNETYELGSVPVQTALGVGTFYAVCMNIDNPIKALAAFGTIQFTRQNAAGFLYYRTRNNFIGQ